mgnify:FL=1
MHCRDRDGSPARRSGLNVLLMLIAASTLLAAACGSQDQAAAPPAGLGTPQTSRQQDDSLKTSLVTRPDKTYVLDELVAAGWKKSRAFETETLPGATAAALGFFNQKDIEVWVYPTHADALQQGVAAAEKAIAKEAGQTDYLIPVVNRYHAYAVVGNLVLLCERELATCEAFIARLP